MFRFIQITDTHIYGDRDANEKRPHDRPVENLTRAIADMHDHAPDAAFVIHTGDVAGDTGEEQDYIRYRKTIAPLKFPLHYLPGNHDTVRAHFRRHVLNHAGSSHPVNDAAHPIHWAFDHQCWRFVGLDSSVDSRVDDDQLQWLHDELSAHRDNPTILLVHHHVMPVGQPKIDSLILENNLDLINCIDPFAQVRAVVGGHVHLNNAIAFRGKQYLSTPSLSWQFTLEMDYDPATFRMPPGYRVFELRDDGTIRTWVRRLNVVPVNEDERMF